MDIDSKEVSRLLEYAAAMSAAKEKVTGNSKLDMASIMAALAMARSDSEAGDSWTERNGGQKSFLHNKFKTSETELKTESSSKEEHIFRATRVNTTMQSNASYENTKLNLIEQKTELPSKQLNVATAKASTAPDLPPRNAALNNNFANKLHASTNIANTLHAQKNFRAAMNDDWKSSNSSMSSSSSSTCSQEEASQNYENKNIVTASTLKSSLDVAKFVKQSKKSVTSESKFLPSSDDVDTSGHSFLKSKQIFEKNENIVVENGNPCFNRFSTISRPKNDNLNAKTLSNQKENGLGKVDIKEESPTSFKDKISGKNSSILQKESPENMAQFLSIVEKMSAEKDKETGNGRLDMAELLAAFNSFQDEDKDNKLKPCSSVSTPLTSSSPPPPPPPTSSPPPLPPSPPPAPAIPSSTITNKSNNFMKDFALNTKTTEQRKETLKHSQSAADVTLDDHAKSSFLKSTLSHATLPSTNDKETNSKSYSDEKNNLLGELKSRLNNEPVSPGSTQSLPRRNFVDNSNQDQVVNKLVYNHYREMLNSYKSANK